MYNYYQCTLVLHSVPGHDSVESCWSMYELQCHMGELACSNTTGKFAQQDSEWSNKLYSYSHVSPTLTAARALCGSSAISWIELVRSTLLDLASPANFLASWPSAIRDRLRYDSVLQRCFHVKNVSPLRKFVSPSTSRVVDHVRKWTRLSLRFSFGRVKGHT